DGSFRLNMNYFVYDRALRMTGARFDALFGRPRRDPESPLDQFHKDVAASLQKVTDEVVVAIANHVRRETSRDNLCMVGGVGLHCWSNSKILERTPFRDIFIQPAAGDAGGAVGAALYAWTTLLGNSRDYVQRESFLGPQFSDADISAFLDSLGIAC